ncbi:MAG: endolytic transglycosylase MltG [Armatimonadetes bacterium]|nr:endolytic transglycosylase MltG [Armatimonadota bacterium]
MSIRRIAVAGVVFLAAAAGAVWWEVRPVGGSGDQRIVLIPHGASTRQIGDRLVEARVVRSRAAFMLALALRQANGRLRHGEYALRPTQSALEIVDVLVRGETVIHRVTIPEGYTARQIADALAREGLVDPDRFLLTALTQARRFARPALPDLPIDSLEGYLFPDTYHLTRGLDEADVIAVLVDRFERAVGADLQAAAQARGLTFHQLLTVASMIEREARVPAERPVVASVIYNRLSRDMRLEIDATVLYALGRHKEVITADDLAVDSPYNTYRYTGLPPGPIANPGLAAIAAAAHPAQTPYLYYVLKPDGSHHFSRTLEEHLAAIRRYRP